MIELLKRAQDLISAVRPQIEAEARAVAIEEIKQALRFHPLIASMPSAHSEMILREVTAPTYYKLKDTIAQLDHEQKFAASQGPLGKEFEKALHDNSWSWELYERRPKSPQFNATAFDAAGALKGIEGVLRMANEQGLIKDTLWYSDSETLFDYIATEIERFRNMQPNAVPQATVAAPTLSSLGAATDATPTPRADALLKKYAGMQPSSNELSELMTLARCLERELAEARGRAKIWEDQAADRMADWDKMRVQKETAEKRVALLEAALVSIADEADVARKATP